MNTAYRQIREGLIVGTRYEIERLVRVGDASDVYACRDLDDNKPVTLVRILRSRAAGSARITEYSREFCLLQKLRHPNLIRVLDFGMLEGSEELYLVQEHVNGDDLYGATEGMPLERVLSLVADVTKALQFLHTRGVTHGNLKVSNAVLPSGSGPGNVRIAGYGLSPLFQWTEQDEMLAYLAPEILWGRENDAKSDLYSLGVVIYLLLARRLPFEDEDPGFLAQKHLQGTADMRPIERLRFGAELSSLVKSLLEKDPSSRPSPGTVLDLIVGLLGRDSPRTDSREMESHFSAVQFVGREREMKLLQECSSRVRESGRGWTVFISGEAGSGKTRCMEELRTWALLDGWRVVEGDCGMRGEAAYDPYRQILTRTGLTGGKAAFRFGRQNPGGVDASSQYAAGQFRDLLTRELIRHLAERPTMLFLHDFHLADDAACAVLDYLSSDIQAHPIFMCVSLRSGEGTKGGLGRVIELAIRHERGEILSLNPLTKENITGLVSGIMGNAELHDSLGAWIFRTVGGNPFFLEEMLQHMVEQKVLRRVSGRWVFVEDDLRNLEVPQSVGAVLHSRLAHLTAPAREILNWLSLIRHQSPRKMLESLVGCDSRTSDQAFAELDQRQMIRIEQKEQDAAIDFCHSLVAEVVRESLSQQKRRSMHRRIAQVIERQYGRETHLYELAMHHIEGASKGEPVRLVLQAGFRYLAEFSHENALRCFEYVFSNRHSFSSEELCAAAIDASTTMFALGIPKRAIHLLNGEMKRNGSIGPVLKARMYMQLALSYQHLGNLRMQEACCKKGLRLLHARSDAECNLVKAGLLAELAFGEVLQSRPSRGLMYLDKAIQFCPPTNATALRGRIHILSALLHHVACNFRDALKACQDAVAILGELRDSSLGCSVYSTYGGVLIGLGRFGPALAKHRQAVAASEQSRSLILKSQALGNLAECLCRMGQLQEAASMAHAAFASVSGANNPAINYAFNAISAEIKLSSCDYKGARTIVSSVAEENAGDIAVSTVGHALYLAATLGFVLGNVTEAIQHIDRMRDTETSQAPFYERELAEALRARIYCEQGEIKKSLNLLKGLYRAVAKKRWPYQMCIIKLHMSEVLIKDGDPVAARRCARDGLRLARAMQSASLEAHSRLLLGLVSFDLWKSGDLDRDGRPTAAPDGAGTAPETAINQLQDCCRMTESSGHLDLAWRGHVELCRIFKWLSRLEESLSHGRKAYELLCKLEDRIPSDSLYSFYRAFGRSHIKFDLVRLIDALSMDRQGDPGRNERPSDDENVRILLRLSSTVNSIRNVDELMVSILDQLIQALAVDRAALFLEDNAGKLIFAKGRNGLQETLSGADPAVRKIAQTVWAGGEPIVSANPLEDPRLSGVSVSPQATGRVLCAQLKVSGRKTGVLYADGSARAGGLSEAAISLFAAFCNLAAVAISNAVADQGRSDCKVANGRRKSNNRYPELVGESPSLELLRDRIGLAAASPLDILITGESGTGKELVARAIFRTGRRQSGKFVAVDCGSLTDSLAEAELFGYRKGAFTGAIENREGLLEAADGGTVFLDEISNMPFRLQAKLLRVLQEREVRRIGEIVPRKVDIQIIAATNKDLLEEMKDGRFRRDLFYRLKMMEIKVPPLRERAEDIPLLIEWFLKKTSELEGGRAKRIRPEAMTLLKNYSYPGNIRELKNIVAGSYYSTARESIGVDELPPEVHREDLKCDGDESRMPERLYREIVEGDGTFEDLVKKPFLKRQFGSSVVREVVQLALRKTCGRYRDAFVQLRIPENRYSVTMQFLKRNNCYLDFRPFRETE